MFRKYLLTRFPVLVVAALLGWILAPAPRNVPQPFAGSVEHQAENPDPSPAPASETVGDTGDPPPPTPSQVLRPNRPVPILPDPIVPTDPPGLLPINQELARHLERVSDEGPISLEAAEHAHMAGKILFMRALYLQSRITAGSVASIEPNAGFETPSSVDEAEKRVRGMLNQAVVHLTRVRPHPSYRFWSEALYLNAWALTLLQRTAQAVDFLQIVGRTRSQTVYANYARFSLVWHFLNEEKGALAAHWLVQITRVEPRHESLLAIARMRTAVAARRPDLVDTPTLAFLPSLADDDPLLPVLLEQASLLCRLDGLDLSCAKGHLSRLSGSRRQHYLGFLAKPSLDRPEELQRLCTLIKEDAK